MYAHPQRMSDCFTGFFRPNVSKAPRLEIKTLSPEKKGQDLNLLVDEAIVRSTRKPRLYVKLRADTKDRLEGKWTETEHERFLDGLKLYRGNGKKWQLISRMIPTRSLPQIRSHAQKYFLKTYSLAAEADSRNEATETPKNLEQKPKHDNEGVFAVSKGYEEKTDALRQKLRITMQTSYMC